MDTLVLSKKELHVAAQLLKEGQLVAFPTETVYGLGAPIFSPKTIGKIFEAKKRPQDNPLIAHVATMADFESLAKDLPKAFFRLADEFFPGPLTLVVKKKEQVPSIVTASLDTIAIRMPNHPLALELIHEMGTPLVAPSANLSGSPSCTTAEHVLEDFKGKIAAVIDGGPCMHGLESTVIDLVSFETPTLLRQGALKKEAIEDVLGQKIALYTSGPKGSPGMKYRHYAPKASVRIFSEKKAFEEYIKTATHVFVFPSLNPQTFYANLRLADQKGYDEVVIDCSECADEALLNRLEKIASHSH